MGTQTAATQTKWGMDPAHSEIAFKVRSMMVANVKGEFEKFDASLTMEGDDLATAQATATIQSASITTRQGDRDNHLRSADFFDVENHKEITFKSKSIEKIDSDHYKMTGELNMHGHTNIESFDVEFGGIVPDPYGNQRAGYTVTGTIDRFNYGLKWNNLLETGGAMVGKEVKLQAEIQLVKQKA